MRVYDGRFLGQRERIVYDSQQQQQSEYLYFKPVFSAPVPTGLNRKDQMTTVLIGSCVT
jgi:hypothetical protein